MAGTRSVGSASRDVVVTWRRRTGGVSYRNKSLPFNDRNTFFHSTVDVSVAGHRSQTHDMYSTYATDMNQQVSSIACHRLVKRLAYIALRDENPHQGRRKGKWQGDMPPLKLPRWIFSLNGIKFLTFNQSCSIIFGFLWALPQTPPHGALYTPLVTERTLLSPPKQIPGYAPDQSYVTSPVVTAHTCSVCYLPPDTGERAPPNRSQKGWYSIYLPQRDGRLSWPKWLATWAYSTEMVYPPANGHPSKY